MSMTVRESFWTGWLNVRVMVIVSPWLHALKSSWWSLM
jgi:hypothetical protein